MHGARYFPNSQTKSWRDLELMKYHRRNQWSTLNGSYPKLIRTHFGTNALRLATEHLYSYFTRYSCLKVWTWLVLSEFWLLRLLYLLKIRWYALHLRETYIIQTSIVTILDCWRSDMRLQVKTSPFVFQMVWRFC